MKKILFIIVLMLSVVNCYSIEIADGCNLCTYDVKKTFKFNVIKTDVIDATKVTNDAYVLIDYKSGQSFDDGTCRVTYYWETENGTYEGKSAIFENIALIYGDGDFESYSVADTTNKNIVTVGTKGDLTILVINYSGDFDDVDIKFK